jgi:hypothetical protein
LIVSFTNKSPKPTFGDSVDFLERLQPMTDVMDCFGTGCRFRHSPWEVSRGESAHLVGIRSDAGWGLCSLALSSKLAA